MNGDFSRATRPPSWSDAHPQRQLVRQRLRIPRQLGDLLRRGDVTRKEDDSAEIEFLRERLKIGGDRMPGKSCERQLTDLATHILQRHCC